ncbi:MAG TPA: hypothetical protein VF599_20260 [Pyrinomonadaceae bacterium]|jgi:hypothetical protein
MKFLFLISFALFALLSALAQEKNNVPKDWMKFDNGIFSFYAPKTLKKQDIDGIDSFFEEYKDENQIVSFDFGIYRNSAGNCEKPISATIDGKSAKICFYEDSENDEDKKYMTAIAFQKLGKSGQSHLTFWVLSKNTELQKEAEKIVRSIKFK